MNLNECLQTWKSEEQQPFLGWDFSYLDGRMLEDPQAVPWLVPGFSVETHLQNLLNLQHRLESGYQLAFTAIKYLLEAYKL